MNGIIMDEPPISPADSRTDACAVPERPIATVRLQFHRGFTFDDARRLVPYYSKLGISHFYASPVLTARAGSLHGYDVVDPGTVNPELGGEDALRSMVASLRAHDMGLIVDIVPNHMAVGRDDNRWWLDVLEWGPESRHANFFDIDWDVPDPALNRRVLAPFLGRPYGEALAAGEIELKFDPRDGRFYASYFDHRFPIAARQYAYLLAAAGPPLAAVTAIFRDALAQKALRSSRREAFDEARGVLARFAEAAHPPQAIEVLLGLFSAKTAEGRAHLHQLLERQHYRLAWWRTAADEINWRRFFDITDLAGLRIQERAVFEAVHSTIFRLYAEGLIDGLRIDHIDGLADPRTYCRRLRARLDKLRAQRPAGAPARSAYVVAEKILAPQEKLDLDWRLDGTSGYVFMSQVSALLHDRTGEEPLRAFWTRSSGRADSFKRIQHHARRRILQDLFSSELEACAHALHIIASSDPMTRDWTLAAVRRVLTEMLVHFPVYRTYADARGRNAEDRLIMNRVDAEARRTCRPGERDLVTCLNRWLGGEPLHEAGGVHARRARMRALARFQQLTSPLAAKAVEDTAFYRYGTLLSRNEVGADPGCFSMSIDEFHRACSERQCRYPFAMLATATHDHKRGEDLRARLAVLSEIPQLWTNQVSDWYRHNAVLKSDYQDGKAPDSSDEYMLYQMIVGAWPLDLEPGDGDGLSRLCERLTAWQQKAIREAKRQSGWIDPDPDYEAACRRFLQRLLDPQVSAPFLDEIHAFVNRIAPAGALNGLAQSLLRLTTPGTPDLYQGCELWDFSLVDPDNRQPVDYARRLSALKEQVGDTALTQRWRDGRLKQRMILRVLALRNRNDGLFTTGEYLPLQVRGERAEHVFAFARLLGDRMAIVAVPLHSFTLLNGSAVPMPASDGLQGIEVLLPRRLQKRQWNDVLGAVSVGPLGDSVSAAFLFKTWPLAFLYSRA